MLIILSHTLIFSFQNISFATLDLQIENNVKPDENENENYAKDELSLGIEFFHLLLGCCLLLFHHDFLFLFAFVLFNYILTSLLTFFILFVHNGALVPFLPRLLSCVRRSVLSPVHAVVGYRAQLPCRSNPLYS